MVKGHNDKFPPSVAEFCKEARRIDEFRKEVASRPDKKKLYRVDRPLSNKMTVERIKKEDARQLVENGAAPRGSIWIPGDLYDHPELGDLYGPDPTWETHHSVPITDENFFNYEPSRTPLERKIAWTEHQYQGRAILAEGKSYDEYRRGCQLREYPIGAQWVPILGGRVYGPASPA